MNKLSDMYENTEESFKTFRRLQKVYRDIKQKSCTGEVRVVEHFGKTVSDIIQGINELNKTTCSSGFKRFSTLEKSFGDNKGRHKGKIMHIRKFIKSENL